MFVVIVALRNAMPLSITATVMSEPAVGWMSQAGSRFTYGRFHCLVAYSGSLGLNIVCQRYAAWAFSTTSACCALSAAATASGSSAESMRMRSKSAYEGRWAIVPLRVTARTAAARAAAAAVARKRTMTRPERPTAPHRRRASSRIAARTTAFARLAGLPGARLVSITTPTFNGVKPTSCTSKRPRCACVAIAAAPMRATTMGVRGNMDVF